MIDQSLAGRIFDYYGITIKTLLSVQSGYRSKVYGATLADGQAACLIIYKAEDNILLRLKNANRIGKLVADDGLPARRAMDKRIVKLHSSNLTTYASLYNYLPGVTIPWEAYTMKHIKALGEGLGRLHKTLNGRPQGQLPSAMDELTAILGTMKHYFDQTGVKRALLGKLNLELAVDLGHQVDVLEPLRQLNPQPLHMDFVRGNILFRPDAAVITGILDFEKAAWGPAVVDVARSLAFLLVDCKYKPDHKVVKYFVQSGYQKRGGQSPVEQQLLERLVSIFLIHDFYKFLLHNPYEFLDDNEHFMRTREQLLRRGLITRKLLS